MLAVRTGRPHTAASPRFGWNREQTDDPSMRPSLLIDMCYMLAQGDPTRSEWLRSRNIQLAAQLRKVPRMRGSVNAHDGDDFYALRSDRGHYKGAPDVRHEGRSLYRSAQPRCRARRRRHNTARTRSRCQAADRPFESVDGGPALI